MDVTVSDPMVGRLLDGRYLIGQRIARGGMATVYEARDTRLDRPVAVKIMHPGYAEDPTFVRRFVREARAAAGLSHAGVVAVFDQGEDNGTLFLAMEYVPGRTLRQLLSADGALSPAHALDLLEQMLTALSVAHEAGIVHLDIKPENVLITPGGATKIADFGLARAVTATSSTATRSVLIGTVSYLSPEQVTHGKADARSDIYALGIVLYEMLTGAKPYTGDSPIHVAYRHVHEDIPPPSRHTPGIPPYVDGLVLRATARNPDDRPTDTRMFLQQARRAREALARGLDDDPELTEDLTLFRRDVAAEELPPGVEPTVVAPLIDPVAAPPSPPADRERAAAAVPITSRRKGLIALLLVLLLTAAAGVGGWYYAVGRFTDVPPLAGLTPAAAERELAAVDLRMERAGKEYDEVIAKGEITRTEPGDADRAVKGSTVDVWVSRGPERYGVPELTGYTEDQARQLAESQNLRIGNIEESYSESVAEGTIISFEPAAGTQLRPDSPINLVISLGREPIEVPDVVGSTAEDAEQAITDRGLTPAATEAFSEEIPEGSVISQEPAEGTLYRGDTVNYVVSKGVELIAVPRVIGQSRADARNTLRDLGFEVQVQKSDVHIGLNVVVEQAPGEGQWAPKGSTILLTTV